MSDGCISIPRVARDPETEKCSTCRYWDRRFDGDDWRTENCLRHAPVIDPFARMTGRDIGYPLYPQVDGRSWCGDWYGPVEKESK